MHNLTKNMQIQRVAPDSGATTTFQLAAGTTDKRTVGVDTRGFTSICWIVLAGAMAASSSLDVKAQQSSDDGSVDDYTDLTGTAGTQVGATDDDHLVVIDCGKVGKRYQALYLTRGDGGNSTIDGIIAILYNGDELPPAVHTTVKSLEVFSGDGEGTA